MILSARRRSNGPIYRASLISGLCPYFVYMYACVYRRSRVLLYYPPKLGNYALLHRADERVYSMMRSIEDNRAS